MADPSWPLRSRIRFDQEEDCPLVALPECLSRRDTVGKYCGRRYRVVDVRGRIQSPLDSLKVVWLIEPLVFSTGGMV